MIGIEVQIWFALGGGQIMQRRPVARADGFIGAVTRLFRHAAVEAVRTGHERIDCTMLDRVRTESPTMIESLATSQRFWHSRGST